MDLLTPLFSRCKRSSNWFIKRSEWRIIQRLVSVVSYDVSGCWCLGKWFCPFFCVPYTWAGRFSLKNRKEFKLGGPKEQCSNHFMLNASILVLEKMLKFLNYPWYFLIKIYLNVHLRIFFQKLTDTLVCIQHTLVRL